MKKYERIFIDAIDLRGRETFEHLFEEVSGPLICLTIEELREVWEAANREGYTYHQLGFTAFFTGFKEYLQSKGIII